MLGVATVKKNRLQLLPAVPGTGAVVAVAAAAEQGQEGAAERAAVDRGKLSRPSTYSPRVC